MNRSSHFQARWSAGRPDLATLFVLGFAVLLFALLANGRALSSSELSDSLHLSTHPLIVGSRESNTPSKPRSEEKDDAAEDLPPSRLPFSSLLGTGFLGSGFPLSDIFLSNYWQHSTEKDPLYRPITVFSFAAQSRIFSNSPFAVSLVHLLLNAVNGVLLLMVVLRLGFSIRMAAVSALVFVSMPLHIEALATVSGRAELLATAFALTAIERFFALVRGRPLIAGEKTTSPRSPKIGIVVTATAYLLGLLCSESIVLLPLLILALDALNPARAQNNERRDAQLLDPEFLDSQSLDFPSSNDQSSNDQSSNDQFSNVQPSTSLSAKSSTIAELPLYSVLALTLAIYLSLRTTIIGFSLPAPHELLQGLSFTSRLTLSAEHLLQYLHQSILPLGFSADYHDYRLAVSRGITEAKPLLALLTLLSIVVAAIVAMSEKIRLPLLATLWFLIAILPMSNLFFATNHLRADLLAYFPSIGICLFIAWIAVVLIERARLAGLLILSAFLMLQALSGNFYLTRWKDNSTLWSHVVQQNPGSAKGWQQLGAQFLDDERFDEAIAAYRKAKQLRHNHGIFDRRSTVELAKIFHRIGHHEVAANLYLQILQRNLKDLTTAISLGQLYLEQSRTHQEALKVFQFTSRHHPNNPHVLAHIAETLKRLGRYAEAREEITKALELNATWAYLHFIQAEILEAQGETALAETSRQTGTRLSKY